MSFSLLNDEKNEIKSGMLVFPELDIKVPQKFVAQLFILIIFVL